MARLDTLEDIANKLEGISAQIEVMAAAFQAGASGTPDPEIIEASLLSVADKVTAASNDLLSLREA